MPAAPAADPADAEPAPPAFDDWLLEQERRQLTWLLAVIIPGAIAFVIADLHFTGPQLLIYPLLRVIMVGLFVTALVAVRQRWPTGTTRGLVAAATLSMGLFVFGRYAAGDGHGTVGADTGTDVVVILAMFMLAQHLAAQMTSALLIIVGCAIDFMYWKALPLPQAAHLLLILILAMAIGMAFARAQRAGLLERWRSQQEIRELRELIPICAWCKNIRSDEGAWERIESYFGRRSAGTAFTHGVCPPCMAEMGVTGGQDSAADPGCSASAGTRSDQHDGERRG